MSDDLFGDVHDLEASHIEEGRAEGVRAGLAAGLAEGRQLGVAQGFEIGAELGFYAGCVQLWRQLQQRDASVIPARAERAIAALHEHLAAYPSADPKDERLHDALDSIRGKFKAAASALGRLGDYVPREEPANGQSF